MRFHIEFKYASAEREKLFAFLDSGALHNEQSFKIVGAWVAVETGRGFAIVESSDAKILYKLVAGWSEHGRIKITPIISVKEIDAVR